MRANDGARSSVSESVGPYGAAVVVACIVALVPLFAIAPFDRPSADDFAYSATTHAVLLGGGSLPELIGAAVRTSMDAYQTWQGLYTSAFLFSLQPGIFGPQWYQVGAYAMLACVIFSCLFLARSAGRYLFASRSSAWAPVGMLLALVMLQGMPQVNEAVYWFNGAANYTPWFCAAMVAAGLCLVALGSARRVRNVASIAVASVLVFLAGGCNYMPSFICVMAMFGFAVAGVRKRRFGLVAPFAFALAGFLVNACAPGTAIRRAMFPDHPGVLSTLAHSAWQALMNVHSFADLSLLVALLMAVPFIAAWARAADRRFSVRGLALSVALSFVALVGVNCVPFYGTGSFGMGRTYNTCFELFVVSAFACWVYLVCLVLQEAGGRLFAPEGLSGRLAGRAAFAPALAVAGVAIVVFWGGLAVEQGHGNSVQAARELANGTAAAYALEYDERDAALSSAGPDGSVLVEPIENRPDVLFFSDVDGQYGDDWSGAIARYYGIGEVVLDDSSGENEEGVL